MPQSIAKILKHRQTWLGALKLAELALLCFAAYYATIAGSRAKAWIFVVLYLTLFALWVVDVRMTVAIRSNLDFLLKYFHNQMGFDRVAEARVTIHRKLSKTHYEQYVDYYPHGAKRGRRYEIKKGLVKFAFESARGQFAENFANVEEKERLLIEKYNFRRDEARNQLNDGEMSYYCCPIMDDGQIWGVLYMNAKISGTFATNDAQLTHAVTTLVRFIEDEVA